VIVRDTFLFPPMLRRSIFRVAAAAAGNTEGTKTSFEEQYSSKGSNIQGGQPSKFTSIHVGVDRYQVGGLLHVLEPFRRHGINLEHIQSRQVPLRSTNTVTSVYLHCAATTDEPGLKSALDEIRAMNLPITNVVGSWDIPWFPTCAADLDKLDQNTLSAGSDLADDPNDPHPGFNDKEYRQRRSAIVENAMSYKHGQPLPTVEYSDKENATWTVVWDKLTALHPTHACQQYRNAFPLLIENANFRRDKVAQIGDLSAFLQNTTGFTIRPVAGLLSTRDFLNALAFSVFYSTQYIRHHSKPLYTPEPDVIHELMGHAPLFADHDFAAFSQEIGMWSLGASDEDIDKLGKLYWYSVEFGLCKEGNGVRAYGAGLLSSFGELEYCLTSKPKKLAWDPWAASTLEFPITTYQPTYFVAESFADAKAKLRLWGRSLDRPFRIEHVPATNSVRMWPRAAFELE
jgi:phenylalanine-4-hydroxylase